MVTKYVSQKKSHSTKLHLHFDWTLKIAKTGNLTIFWRPEAVKRSYHKWDILSDFQTLYSKLYFTLCKKYSMPDEYQQRLDADAIATLSLFAYYNKLKLTLQSCSEKRTFFIPPFLPLGFSKMLMVVPCSENRKLRLAPDEEDVSVSYMLFAFVVLVCNPFCW